MLAFSSSRVCLHGFCFASAGVDLAGGSQTPVPLPRGAVLVSDRFCGNERPERLDRESGDCPGGERRLRGDDRGRIAARGGVITRRLPVEQCGKRSARIGDMRYDTGEDASRRRKVSRKP